MRKINSKQFQRATRSTPREINRKIVLNLVWEHQPISRAEVARRMNVSRAMVTPLVNELLANNSIYEGTFALAPRGRRPQMLHIRTRDRLVIAVDVGFSRTQVLLSDFGGSDIALETFATVADPGALADELTKRVQNLLRTHGSLGVCEGIGLVVPGMVDRCDGRILHAPALGWQNIDMGAMLASHLGLPVFVENAPVACALAQMWLKSLDGGGADNFAFITVSDGVGAGAVVDGQVLCGPNDTAVEFGHLSLNTEGPQCACGLRGCLEAYTSNLATLGRYLGLNAAVPEGRDKLRRSGLTVAHVITRARSGDAGAAAALRETARYLGIGLAGIIATLKPERFFLDGEIIRAWDMIAAIVWDTARERTLADGTIRMPIIRVSDGADARLRGAIALLVAREFAAPQIG